MHGQCSENRAERQAAGRQKDQMQQRLRLKSVEEASAGRIVSGTNCSPF